MKNIQIFIVGSGKLANTILTSDISFPSCEILKWDASFRTLNEKAIIVHAGSGRQLEENMEFCSKTKSVLIELSTGQKTEKTIPDFPLIICPNTSILVLKTLQTIKSNSTYFENYKISITESHQSTKNTEPGTALAFANALKFPPDKIISIRDKEIQKNQIMIPTEYLDKHAFHKIIINDDDDEIIIETKVLGHKSYVNGVKKIIEMVLKSNLENKKYSIFDFIENKML